MARGINMSWGACPLPEPISSKQIPSMGPYFSNELIINRKFSTLGNQNNIKKETQIHIQHNTCINRSIIFWVQHDHILYQLPYLNTQIPKFQISMPKQLQIQTIKEFRCLYNFIMIAKNKCNILI
jgi:hypothetical protein